MGRGVFWLKAGLKRRDRDTAGPEDATPLDRRMMQRALKLARAAGACGEVPVGAVVYESATGKVLAEAGNTREGACDPAGHAELTAILAAARAKGSWRLDDCTLAVTLEPCAMCAGLIVNARVGRVVFGAHDPKAGFVGSLGNLLADDRLNHRVRAISGVLSTECGSLLTGFFAQLRKRRRGGGA